MRVVFTISFFTLATISWFQFSTLATIVVLVYFNPSNYDVPQRSAGGSLPAIHRM